MDMLNLYSQIGQSFYLSNCFIVVFGQHKWSHNDGVQTGAIILLEIKKEFQESFFVTCIHRRLPKDQNLMKQVAPFQDQVPTEINFFCQIFLLALVGMIG